MISYSDPFVSKLCDQISELVLGRSDLADAVSEAVFELAVTNSEPTRRYWSAVGKNIGVPETAFRGSSLFFYSASNVARVFYTSGTSRQGRGIAQYSAKGLELMHLSIVENARRNIFSALDRPSIIRLVPDVEASPDVIMAYGMSVLSETFGNKETSVCVVKENKIDLDKLILSLERSASEQRPVVMLGGSFAFVQLCDLLNKKRLKYHLPEGSLLVDAGGFKGRSRELNVSAFREYLSDSFCLDAKQFINLFGMTELAGQLYDVQDTAVGPSGERPKGALPFIVPSVIDPLCWKATSDRPGILQVRDYCIIDRPQLVLTGDGAIPCEHGVAITGRIQRAEGRGCALSFESIIDEQ